MQCRNKSTEMVGKLMRLKKDYIVYTYLNVAHTCVHLTSLLFVLE